MHFAMPSLSSATNSTMTSRKKPGVASWATVILVVSLAYPLSFGPACWLGAPQPAMVAPLKYFYWPLTRFAWMCPRKIALDPLCNYGLWGLSRDSEADPMAATLRVGAIFGFGRPGR